MDGASLPIKDKNWEEAQAHFNDAWAAMPERAETLYYLGLTTHRLRQHKLALVLDGTGTRKIYRSRRQTQP